MPLAPQTLHQKPSHAISVLMLCLLLFACNRAPATTNKTSKLLTGKVEVTEEAKRILPKGTVIYYSKSAREPGTQYDRWAIEALDVHTGKTEEFITNQTSGIIDLIPYSISPDKKHLLFGGKQKNGRNALFELNLRTKKWHKIRDYVLAGHYSQDGKLIAMYYEPEPESFEEKPILRAGILTRKGSIVETLPCNTTQCFHSNWYKKDIIFSEGGLIDSSEYGKLYLYSFKTKHLIEIFKTNRKNTTISRPQTCNNKIYFLIKNKQKTYIPEIRRTSSKTSLIILQNNHRREIKLNSAIGVDCIPDIKNHLLVTRLSPRLPKQNVELIRIDVLNIQKNKFNRILAKPSSVITRMAPVVQIIN